MLESGSPSRSPLAASRIRITHEPREVEFFRLSADASGRLASGGTGLTGRFVCG